MLIPLRAARLRDRARAYLGATLAAAIVVATSGQAQASEDTRYKYDAQGQVILKSRSSGQQNGYAYDQAGNRLNVVGGVQVPPTYPDRLLQGQSLLPGKSLSSANGLYSLILQDDGNLVLYGQNWVVRWQANTAGKTSARLTMQGDGNLVIYGPVSQAYWATGTSSGPGSALILQDDGNLVVYSSGGAALWHIYQ